MCFSMPSYVRAFSLTRCKACGGIGFSMSIHMRLLIKGLRSVISAGELLTPDRSTPLSDYYLSKGIKPSV